MKVILLLLILMQSPISSFGQVTVNNHKADWDFYLTNVNSIIGSIALDLGYHSSGPVRHYDQLLRVSILMQHPSSNGLSSKEELQALGAIEDSLVPYFAETFQGLFVGRLTTDGRRDFYFYTKGSKIDDKDVKVPLLKFPTYKYAFELKADKRWSTYFDFLYPNPKQMQSIQNRRVVDNLEKNGDPLTKARKVDHWIYFKNEDAAKRFIDQVQALGFALQAHGSIDAKDDWKYQVHIYRVDYVDYQRINEVALTLFDLAEKCEGDYDGWETSVEK